MMSNAIHERHPLFPLSQWIGQVCYQPNLHVRVRLRGNVLHVLFEAPSVPRQPAIAKALVKALQILNINTLIPGNQPSLYQVMLYGRKQDETRPAWTMPIYLNQLPQHLAELQAADVQQMAEGITAHAPHLTEIAQPETQQPESYTASKFGTPATATASVNGRLNASESGESSVATPPHSDQPQFTHSVGQTSSALVLPTRSLAKQGTPSGIACYLSEILNILGISVQVKVKTLPLREGGVALSSKRMWILCEAPYSPDPRVVAEPTAQRLRDLELEGFRDAVILIQVQGEPRPEWFLRVDLTPKTELLKEWARWGDLDAIAALANDALPQDIHVTPELKSPTLYLFCRHRSQKRNAPGSDSGTAASSDSTSDSPSLPDQATVQATLEPLLQSLAPQGIHAAVLYGQGAPQTSPVWMHWLNLPATEHEALATRTQELASQGDRPALAYWLMRSLNPDLPHQLATGGIRIQLAQRGDVLHIMADAPICPSRRQVGKILAKEMRRLKVPGIKGLRVYGRRAGQKRPLWSFGIDLQPRPRQIVPEATPEFAASEAYVGDLISRSEEDVVIREEITSETVRNRLAELWQQNREHLQGLLLRSQLFVPQSSVQDLKTTQDTSSAPTETFNQRRSLLPVAAVWGAVGMLVVFQADWIGGQILKTAQSTQQEVADDSTMRIDESALASSDPPLDTESPFWEEANISFSLPGEEGEEDEGDDGFAREGFTDDSDPTVIDPNQDETTPQLNPLQVDLEASPFQDRLSALDYSYGTFNSRQMDIKMALYQRQVDQFGVPDVLIFGSSRSLRGVDPAKLKEDLAAQGYEDVSIFNFGINGATAQVADLILRRFLSQDQLPKLIIWADGARAFNSGRLDVTYNGIVASEGYQDLMAARAEQLAAEAAALDAEAAAAAQQAAAELAAEANNTSLFSSYQTVDEKLEETVSNWSALHSERDRIKGFLQDRFSAWLPFATPEPLAVNAPVGEQDPDVLLADEGESMIDVDGFLPISTQFNPATYYQQYARVSGLYDGDYKDFSLDGKQAEALNALLDFTSAQGIPVVFINTPTTDEYMDAARFEHEQEFVRWMLQQSASHDGFIFRDLSEMWPQQYAYFSDPSHLNRYGAYQVSERIAQDPMIPWSAAQSDPDASD